MLISIYGTASRPYLWQKVYDSVEANCTEVDFEIIYAGPNEPDFSLPNNFKHIKTNVKPSQCMQIALNNCQGDYVVLIADDQVVSSGSIDIIYNAIRKKEQEVGHDKTLIAPRFFYNGKGWGTPYDRKCGYTKNYDKGKGPLINLGGIIKRSFMEKLGGFDRRFLATWAAVDMAMRIWEIGGQIIPKHTCFFNEIQPDDIRVAGKCKVYGDKALIDRLWTRKIIPNEEVPSDEVYGYYRTKEFVLSKKRLDKVEFFEQDNLLLKSQSTMLPNCWLKIETKWD